MLSEGSYILRDPGAASQDNRMFVVKVYYSFIRSRRALGHLLLLTLESVPETFELPASDWPEIFFWPISERRAAG